MSYGCDVSTVTTLGCNLYREYYNDLINATTFVLFNVFTYFFSNILLTFVLKFKYFSIKNIIRKIKIKKQPFRQSDVLNSFDIFLQTFIKLKASIAYFYNILIILFHFIINFLSKLYFPIQTATNCTLEYFILLNYMHRYRYTVLGYSVKM